jgi:hypothetical protein
MDNAEVTSLSGRSMGVALRVRIRHEAEVAVRVPQGSVLSQQQDQREADPGQ